jgi:hypothetical protein
MLLSNKQLVEIKAMVDTLPNLPWGYYPRGNRDNSVLVYAVAGRVGENIHEATVKESDYPEDYSSFEKDDDKAEVIAEFISKAPETIQSLLVTIEEQRQEIERLKEITACNPLAPPASESGEASGEESPR